MRFFTADQHFWHENIIKYCDRPFGSISHMNKKIIRNYNYKVEPEDEVFFVGDFSLSSNKNNVERMVEKLNGTKHLILGNHDRLRPFEYIDIGFTSVHTSLEVPGMFGGSYLLNHDPSVSEIAKDKLFLCGHIHNLFKMTRNVLNIGVDVWDFYPVSEEEIINTFWRVHV